MHKWSLSRLLLKALSAWRCVVKHKTVEGIAYQFDSLPGHIRVSGRGSGATLRVALQRAVGNLFNQPALLRKRLDSFKLSVVVITERPTEDRRPRELPVFATKGGAS